MRGFVKINVISNRICDICQLFPLFGLKNFYEIVLSNCVKEKKRKILNRWNEYIIKKEEFYLKIYMKIKIESLESSTYFSEIWCSRYRIHSENNNFLFINHYKIFYSIQIKRYRILWSFKIIIVIWDTKSITSRTFTKNWNPINNLWRINDSS